MSTIFYLPENSCLEVRSREESGRRKAYVKRSSTRRKTGTTADDVKEHSKRRSRDGSLGVENV